MNDRAVKLTALISGVVVLLAVAAFAVIKSTSPPASSGPGVAPGVVAEPNVPIVNGIPAKDGIPGLGQKDDNLPADPAMRSGQ